MTDAASTLRTLIVDDEPAARRVIGLLLRHDPEIEVIGECRDGAEAVEAIRRDAPDLVFLDVQMPELDGFEALGELEPEFWPLVVFVTAYDSYALRAFEVHAVDYLLKPFSDERFREALERAKRRIRERRADLLTERLFELVDGVRRDRAETERETDDPRRVPRPFIVKSVGRLHFVAPNEIRWVEAAGDYVRLHTTERTHLLRETMQRMEARLEPSGFVRIHRSSLVRLDTIEQVRMGGTGEYEATLEDGTQLRVSRSGRRRLERRIGRRL